MSTLKDARKARGMTQQDLAEHLGITRQTYGAYENEQDRMTVGQAKAVCAVLRCSINDLFPSEEAEQQTSV